MSAADNNKEAAKPNHSMIAAILPTIRPPKALATADGYAKVSTAQVVIARVLNLCLMAGILGSCVAFAECTTGTDALTKLSFSTAKLEQWSAKFDLI